MIASLLLPALGLAAILAGNGPSVSFEGVTLPEKANLEVQGRRTGLESVGHGLRYKKVAFLKVRVYVGELFLSEPKAFVRDLPKALDSIAGPQAVVMQMTFVREVEAAKVQEAFRESFEENKVSLGDAPVRKFLEAVKAGGAAKEGKTLTVAGEKIGAKDLITYEGTDGNAVTIEGPSGFRKEIFSLWLGKAADSGVENLQSQILGK